MKTVEQIAISTAEDLGIIWHEGKVSEEGILQQEAIDFAKAFLARVDQERAKAGAVAYAVLEGRDIEDSAWGFTASWPEVCHEHINAAINEHNIEGAGDWRVVPLYLSPTPPVWISVEDRLPDNGTEILCLLTSGEMKVLEFSQHPEWRFIDRYSGGWWKLKVRAWIPLPAAPEVPK